MSIGTLQSEATNLTILQLISSSELEAANQLFHRSLPKIGDIRDASAHPTEPGINSFDGPYRKHGFNVDEGVSRTMLTGGSGRTLFVTVKETVLEYELSNETMATLITVRDAIYAVFKPASDALWNKFEERHFQALRNGE